MVIWNEVGVEETSHNGFEGFSWAIEVTMFYLIDGSDPWLNGSIWVGSKWPNFLFLFPLLEADSMALPWVCIFIGLPLYGSFVCEDIKLAVSDTRLVLIKQLISTLVLHWKEKKMYLSLASEFWVLLLDSSNLDLRLVDFCGLKMEKLALLLQNVDSVGVLYLNSFSNSESLKLWPLGFAWVIRMKTNQPMFFVSSPSLCVMYCFILTRSQCIS